MELAKVRNRLRERGLELELTEDAKQFLIKKGSNLDYGARPLRRAIESFIEDPLSEELLKGEFEGKNHILVEAIKDDEDKLRRLSFIGKVIEKQPEPAAAGVGGADAEDASESAAE